MDGESEDLLALDGSTQLNWDLSRGAPQALCRAGCERRMEQQPTIGRLIMDTAACCSLLLDLLVCLMIPRIRELNAAPSALSRSLESGSLFLTLWLIFLAITLGCLYLHLRMLVHFCANPGIPTAAKVVLIPFFLGLIWVVSPLYYFFCFRRNPRRVVASSDR